MSNLPYSKNCYLILQSINDGVFTVDRDWRVTSFNKAAERITGMRREEVLGERCRDVFQSSICDGKCALRYTWHSGEPIINKAIHIVNAQGRRIPISISTAVLKNEDGEVVGGVETFRDLSVVEDLRRRLKSDYTFVDIIGRSPAMQRLFDIVPQMAASDSTVLIEGNSGTGKELFARAIHSLSRRHEKRFVAVNCSALPDTLLESELFGYKAGAFTDARQDKPGRFALAEGGTILLDEIGDISPAMQSRLLRVLQERVYEPLGSVTTVKSNVRVIAATNRNLRSLVSEGKFREDLFYRINVVRLQLPELRERRQDIPLLVERFVAKFNALQGKDVAGLSDEALALIMRHDCPGNVRELENIIEHAFVLCSTGLIQPRHLPQELRGAADMDFGMSPTTLTLSEFEAIHIADAVDRHDGNRKAAAEELGIDASTLFRKVKSLGIKLPKARGERGPKHQ